MEKWSRQLNEFKKNERERLLAVVYMYIGVSCPVRSLNMAAGMVFMWIWRRRSNRTVSVSSRHSWCVCEMLVDTM